MRTNVRLVDRSMAPARMEKFVDWLRPATTNPSGICGGGSSTPETSPLNVRTRLIGSPTSTVVLYTLAENVRSCAHARTASPNAMSQTSQRMLVRLNAHRAQAAHPLLHR